MTETWDVVDTRYGTFLARHDDLITRQLQQFGSHAGGELAMLLSVVKPGDIAIDVGAHIGTFSVPLARAVGTTGRVVAFEPFLPSYELLVLNAELNGVSGTLLTRPLAIGPSQASWSVVESQESNTGATYLAPLAEGTVTSVGLDEWVARNRLGHVDVIKVDTEGMECAVLSTAMDILDTSRPIIYAEVAAEFMQRFGDSPAALQELLNTHGYRTFRNTGKRQDTSSGGFQVSEIDNVDGEDFFDVLAVPPEKIGRLAHIGADL